SFFFFFSSRRRHTRFSRDWSSDVCSSDLYGESGGQIGDTGVAFSADGAEFPIVDTLKKLGDMYVHIGKLSRGSLKVGDIVEMKRSEERRVGKEGRSRWSPAH